MAREVQIVGGPRDGQFVPDYGPEYREPIHRAPRVYFSADEALASEPFDLRRFHKEIWSVDGKPRYVLETTDLGQPSFHPREEI